MICLKTDNVLPEQRLLGQEIHPLDWWFDWGWGRQYAFILGPFTSSSHARCFILTNWHLSATNRNRKSRLDVPDKKREMINVGGTKWVNAPQWRVLPCAVALAFLPHKAFQNSLSHFSSVARCQNTRKNVRPHDVTAPAQLGCDATRQEFCTMGLAAFEAAG